MTAQFHDRVLYQGEGYSLAGVNKGHLFDPTAHDLSPVMHSTACYRGFVGIYRVTEQLRLETLYLSTKEPVPSLFDVQPQPDNSSMRWDAVYENLGHPISYMGGLLVARGFIKDLYVHMGFHPAWKYEEVHELLFEEGVLRQEIDRSAQMAALRAELASRPRSPTNLEDRAAIERWISQCFSQEYD